MSKAEEYSFNIPSKLFQQLTKEQQVLWRKEIESAFNNGYHQAEKDLELTWEDISIIRQIMFDYNRTIRNGMNLPSNENYCKEVLKRFKERNKL